MKNSTKKCYTRFKWKIISLSASNSFHTNRHHTTSLSTQTHQPTSYKTTNQITPIHFNNKKSIHDISENPHRQQLSATIQLQNIPRQAAPMRARARRQAKRGPRPHFSARGGCSKRNNERKRESNRCSDEISLRKNVDKATRWHPTVVPKLTCMKGNVSVYI